MLKVWFGAAKNNVLYYPDEWFAAKGYKYLSTDFSKKLLTEIEKCSYIADKVVESKILGVIPSKMISTGTKALMQLKYSDYPVDANWLGDNLMPYLRDLGEEQDIVVITGFFFPVYTPRNLRYQIEVLNTGRVIYDSGEFYDEYTLAIPEKGKYKDYPLYSR